MEFTWTEGIRAELKFRGIAAGTPLKLQAILVGFTHAKELSEQDVEVLANEKQIAAWKVGPEKEEYAAIIPADAASLDGVLTLEFRVPKAASPSQFGDSPDKRLLGLRFYEVIINKSS